VSTAERPRRAGGAEERVAAPRRRADAERSISAIVDAALGLFVEQPQVTMAAIAREAGVGRVTLYAHFPSREAVLEAALDRAIAEADAVIEAAAPDEDPADEALARVIRSSWAVLDRHRRLFEAAQRDLGAQRLRRHHDRVMTRVEKLLGRGRDEGVFRDDLPMSWLVTSVYSLLHAAAEDVNGGRLRREDAAHVLEATLLPALAPPGRDSRPGAEPTAAARSSTELFAPS
jgi:AcrR family transcriptional regulator